MDRVVEVESLEGLIHLCLFASIALSASILSRIATLAWLHLLNLIPKGKSFRKGQSKGTEITSNWERELHSENGGQRYRRCRELLAMQRQEQHQRVRVAASPSGQ